MRRFLTYWLMLGCLGCVALAAPRAGAAIYTVTTTADNTTGTCTANSVSDGCTLRAAITAANTDAATDAIDFAEGLAGQTITLTSALPDITTSLDINRFNEKITVARSSAAGTAAFKIFYVGNANATGPTVNIKGLTLANGKTLAFSDNLTPRDYDGGDFFNQNGVVLLDNCVLTGTTDNSAAASSGGGIANYGGTLSLNSTTVSGFTVTAYGGGIFNNGGALNLNRSAVSGNTASLDGGGIASFVGAVTLTNSGVTKNASQRNGGGILTRTQTTLISLDLFQNTAQIFGGGLYNDGGTVTLTKNSSVSDNAAQSLGGGIENRGTLTVTNSAIVGNSGLLGGGIDCTEVTTPPTTTLTNTTLSDNAATNSNGGGFYVEGTATLANCTVARNTTPFSGGGLYVRKGQTTLTNCTVASNAAEGYGGGLYNTGLPVTLNSCTVTRNTAAANRGSGIAASSGAGSTTLSNSIVAGNTNSDADITGATNTFVSNGYNLVGTSGTGALTAFTAAKNDKTNVNPTDLHLGPLQDNGGPTQTIALQPGSIAIDQGNTDLTRDQRGVRRPLGEGDDVGAYEFNGTPSFVVTITEDEDDGTSDPNFGTSTGTSLREAIADANVYSNPPKTITFADNVVGKTITLNSALPDITASLDISNPVTTLAQSVTIARNPDANTDFRILTVGDGTEDLTVNLSGLTLTGGKLTSTSIEPASYGGGLLDNGSTVTLTNCTLSGNSTATQGGGVENYTGRLTLINCTVSNNTSSQYGGGVMSTSGGSNTNTLTNCTLSGNSSQSGGGLYIQGEGTLTNCTLSGNTATYGGGVFFENDGALSNTIVSGNSADNGGDIYVYPSGTLSSNGHNVVGSTNDSNAFSTQSGDQTGVTLAQLRLGDLADNGGPTQTRALLAGSVAIDAGDTALTTDQRGVARPFGDADDVGAFEFNTVLNESLVVTTTADEDNGTSDPTYGGGAGTSLREAINYANKKADQSDITFADNIVGQTITLDTALPNLKADLTIKNTGAQTITLARSSVDGTPEFNILIVDSGTATGLTVSLQGLTLTNGRSSGAGNTLSSFAGAGIYTSNNALTLLDCTISGNTADQGGGIYAAGGTLGLTNCTVTGNTGVSYGGGLANSGGTAKLINCIVSGNSTQAYGGGIENISGDLALTNCTVSGNSAVLLGGGIDSVKNGAAPTTTLLNCTVSGNVSVNSSGGGLSLAGTSTLTNCTLSGNTANNASGGGILLIGAATLTNCTFSGNSANSASGGGILITGAGTLLNCTFSSNTATFGGGIFISGQGTLGNTLVVGNTAPNGGDLYLVSGLISRGYNLVGATNMATAFNQPGDKTGVTSDQVKLGDLADNGGPTQTRALQRGSIAFNAGNPDTTGLPATDQRGAGYSRVVDGRVDVGAFEAQFVAVHGKVYNAVARAGLSGITVTAEPTIIIISGHNPVIGQGPTSGQGPTGGQSPKVPVTRAIPAGDSTLTDADGNYTLYLDAGSYNISASKDGDANYRFNALFSNPVSIPSTGTAGASYDFRSIGIGGRVISPNNIGVQNVTLTLTPQGSSTTTQQITDADGFFSFDGLAAGTYTIAPSGSSNLTFAPPSRTLALADKPLFTSFKASAKIGYVIGGSVTINQDGTPTGLEGVEVTATRVSDGKVFTAQTKSDGSYSLEMLSEDRYTVTAQANGFVFTYAPTPKQSQPLVLTAGSPAKAGINFTAKRQISGTVYNAVALQGLSGVVVKGVRQSDGQTLATGTDENGRYTLALEAGSYTLTAFVPNNNAFPIVPASFTNPVTIPATLPKNSKVPHIPGYDFRAVGIAGRVISPNNTGISGVTLKLYAPKDTGLKNPLRSVVSDSQGFFSFDGIVPGNWNVVPVSPTTYTYEPGSRLVEVKNEAVFISFKASVKKAPKSLSGARSSIVLSSASANSQTGALTLHFTGALDAGSVADLSHYAVQVDGEAVSIVSAALIKGGDTIVLTLAEDALRKGSRAEVSWAGVLDAQGLPLQGEVQVTAS